MQYKNKITVVIFYVIVSPKRVSSLGQMWVWMFKCSYLSDKLTWKVLPGSTFCHCTHTVMVVCAHAWPLRKVCCILHFCPTHTLLRARDGIVRISFSTVKTRLPLANHSLAIPITWSAAWHIIFIIRASSEVLTSKMNVVQKINNIKRKGFYNFISSSQ